MASMRPLLIDDAAKAKAASVVAYAKDHPYSPGQPTPGDNPHFVAKLDTYRAVFTFTKSDGGLWRHLSVSVPSATKYPNVAAVFSIAALFGFTGWDERTINQAPTGWHIDISHRDHCIVVVQAIGSDDTRGAN